VVAPAVADWKTDTELKEGFAQKTLTFTPDYDGDVTASLVRNDPVIGAAKGAILYLHGFIDYFFQRHVAERFNRERFNFYALDLRKYGRSLAGAKHPNICLEFSEYFEEISAAIDIILAEGHSSVTLMAHSTGALPAALYAKEGARGSQITSLIFNSPFLALPQGKVYESFGLWFGAIHPFGATDNRINPWYVRSLHTSQKGVWDFNLKLKPLDGFDVYYGWLRVVVTTQRRLRKGFGLEQPVLIMHSDKSEKGSQWKDSFHRADLVLNVDDIKKIGPQLGAGAKLQEIPDGKHDLTLSVDGPREHCLQAMLEWVTARS
jgi:alpha-beta hydrolase superfamily lysophospholipase